MSSRFSVGHRVALFVGGLLILASVAIVLVPSNTGSDSGAVVMAVPWGEKVMFAATWALTGCLIMAVTWWMARRRPQSRYRGASSSGSASALAPELWVVTRTCGRRDLLGYNPHASPGRIGVMCGHMVKPDSDDVVETYQTSKADIVAASDAARCWLEGYAAGGELPPEPQGNEP